MLVLVHIGVGLRGRVKQLMLQVDCRGQCMWCMLYMCCLVACALSSHAHVNFMYSSESVTMALGWF